MPEIIVRFNNTNNSSYKSYAKVLYDITYTDNSSTLTTNAVISAKFYIKPDAYTYTQNTSDTLKLGIKIGDDKQLYSITPTGTNGDTIDSNVYNYVGQKVFEVNYLSTKTSYVYLFVEYNNSGTSRFAPFYMPSSEGGSYEEYSYISGTSNKITLAKRFSPTDCQAPTAIKSNKTLFADTVKISWSGAQAGTANSIVGYDVEYCVSSNNTTWGTWTSIDSISSTGTSCSCYLTPSMSAGYYVKFRVRTRGSAGASYYSDYIETVGVKKNASPRNITSLNLSKYQYNQGDSVTMSWSAPYDETAYSLSYVIEISANNAQWVTFKETSLESFSFIPTEVENSQSIKYRIKAVDSLGLCSAYTESQALLREDISAVKVCVDGIYKEAKIKVCISGQYCETKVYVCEDGAYELAG